MILEEGGCRTRPRSLLNLISSGTAYSGATLLYVLELFELSMYRHWALPRECPGSGARPHFCPEAIGLRVE